MFDEELLEPLARKARFKEGISYLMGREIRDLVDLGCGPKTRFYFFCKKKGYKIQHYIGIDPLLTPEHNDSVKNISNIQLVQAPLVNTIPLPDSSTDYVTGFAFLEHIDHPQEIIAESVRILRPGGKAIFTAPAERSKAILEFLSYRLHLISEREIREHKTYFTKEIVMDFTKELLPNAHVTHKYFEFGLNNLIVIQKQSS